MIRLPRTLASFARAAAPSARLAPWRYYSTEPFALREGAPEHPPKVQEPKSLEQKRADGPWTTQKPLTNLEAPLPEGITADATSLAVNRGSKKYHFLYTALRDACKCPQCVDPYSKQRKFRTGDVNVHVQPRSIQLDGDSLTIKWARDMVFGHNNTHVSTYNVSELYKRRPISRAGSSGPKRPRVLWGRDKMDRIQHWISYNDYIHDEEKFVTAMRHLSVTGLLFVKDIPDSRDEVEKLATRMGPLRNTFYGPTWDVRSVPQAKNIAYTNQDLGFHMDLMYMRDPPGYQLLHCLENSCEGGESLFLDAFSVARNIHTEKPEVFKHLTELNLNYEYEHADHIYNNSWPVFEVGPNHTKEFFDVRHVNYSPPFQGRMPELHYKNVASKYLRALHFFARELESNYRIFQLKLKPGECAIFENRRVLHARRPFDLNSGNRWLAGAYVDEDSLMSRFETARRKYPHAWFGLDYAPPSRVYEAAEIASQLIMPQKKPTEQDTAAPETQETEQPKETERPKEAETKEAEETKEARNESVPQ